MAGNTVSQTLALAVKCHQAGDLRQAEMLYRQVLQIDPLNLQPELAKIHFNLGNALFAQGKLEEAAGSYQQGLRLQPELAEAHFNLGNILKAQGKFDEAITSYQSAVRLKPEHFGAYTNQGNVLGRQGKHDEAITCYQQALRLKPELVEAHTNLGHILRDKGKLDEALASYRQALVLKPDFIEAHHSLAMLLLLRGEFPQGWQEYEWRWRVPGVRTPRAVTRPLWTGEPLAGRTILLHAEQGLGDTLQFVRFARQVKACGAGRLLLECARTCARLMKQCDGIDGLCVRDEPLPHFDVHLPLLSLPRVLQMTLETIPQNVPYLHVDPELIQHWRDRLAGISGLRVGIVWQGNAQHVSDRWRSVALERFSELAEVPGISLISLQKGLGSEQLAKMPGLALDLGPELNDLADTGAVLKCLDLVVSVDTAIVHLAGALAVTAWVALPFNPDWRWLLNRADSPWYPTLRLFRQTEPGQWDDVFRRIKIALERFPH